MAAAAMHQFPMFRGAPENVPFPLQMLHSLRLPTHNVWPKTESTTRKYVTKPTSICPEKDASLMVPRLNPSKLTTQIKLTDEKFDVKIRKRYSRADDVTLFPYLLAKWARPNGVGRRRLAFPELLHASTRLGNNMFQQESLMDQPKTIPDGPMRSVATSMNYFHSTHNEVLAQDLTVDESAQMFNEAMLEDYFENSGMYNKTRLVAIVGLYLNTKYLNSTKVT
ncbi:hypothetical protein EG68_04089 [Paragonimus skrjabini miyazakii]|uniref:Uncharacterized protein n=1 Tax=Paragonimus skrjabini miyazakii TaxID=59628 RepID=A0A8S9YUH1_9TREM|nr:hypothetical protein EG68_04089 [Paragonimus skrjabini miyazakii]